MEKKKAVWYLLVAAVCGVLAFNLWFSRPRSLLDIAGLRGQEVERIWVNWNEGVDDYGTRVTGDPDEMAAYLSALDEIRFHFSDTVTLVGDRIDHFAVYRMEGGYASFNYSSGDGTMVYRDSGSRRSRVFHISGDPAQLKPLFDMVDTWPKAENS